MNNLSFEHQITIHEKALHLFAFNFTKDREEANDLVQDTYMKACQYSSYFQNGTNLKAWLYTILRNTFYNNMRRLSTKNKVVTTTEDLNSNQLHISATSNKAVDSLMSEDINKALKKLPSNYAEPFLKFFEGYKYEEISTELNLPLGTVKTRIHHARKMLQKDLKMYAN